MRTTLFSIGLVASGIFAGAVHAEMPRNVKCAIEAQQAARSMGSEYQATYNRKFEHCMLSAMPRESQTEYLVERLQPYVAVSPGLEKPEPVQRERAKSTGTWVRISPNVWILEQ